MNDAAANDGRRSYGTEIMDGANGGTRNPVPAPKNHLFLWLKLFIFYGEEGYTSIVKSN
jgi:hypothetical protein